MKCYVNMHILYETGLKYIPVLKKEPVNNQFIDK